MQWNTPTTRNWKRHPPPPPPPQNKKKNSNKMSFICYINYTMIKLMIYFNSHIYIYSYRTVVHTNIKQMPILFFTYIFFGNKCLRQPSMNFRFWNLTSSGDVVYKKCWWHNTSWLLIYFMLLWALYLFKLLNSKCHQIGKYQ